MTELDQLPVDQRAALSLLLGRGMTYAAVAGLLALDQAAVRERALAALSGLEPLHGDQLTRERRGEIGDYLLGQQPASQRTLTRQYLSTSPAARAWAWSVASSLAPLCTDLAEMIPPEGREVDEPPPVAAQGAAAAADAAYRSSRRGGILALGALAVVVAAVIVIVLSLSGSSKPGAPVAPPTSQSSSSVATQTIATTTPRSGAGARTSTSTAATASTTTAPILAQITFAPPDPSSRALAVANVMQDGRQTAFALRAQGLAPTHRFAYAVWLYNSETDARPLGFIDQRVTANGHALAVGVLPLGALHYREIVITRETTRDPGHPGPIVLAAELAPDDMTPGRLTAPHG